MLELMAGAGGAPVGSQQPICRTNLVLCFVLGYYLLVNSCLNTNVFHYAGQGVQDETTAAVSRPDVGDMIRRYTIVEIYAT